MCRLSCRWGLVHDAGRSVDRGDELSCMMRLARVVLGLLLWSATVAAQQYVISTYAGGPPLTTPVLGVDVPISGAVGVATDAAGNAYFTSLRCVFKLDQPAIATRVSGNSRAGYSGDGG